MANSKIADSKLYSLDFKLEIAGFIVENFLGIALEGLDAWEEDLTQKAEETKADEVKTDEVKAETAVDAASATKTGETKATANIELNTERKKKIFGKIRTVLEAAKSIAANHSDGVLVIETGGDVIFKSPKKDEEQQQ